MTEDPKRLYWDADVFLSLIEDHPGRAPLIQSLLADARGGIVEVVTSAITIAEVAYASAARLSGAPAPDVEREIDALWEAGGPVGVVEVYPLLAVRARDIIRASVGNGWTGLRAHDAIHLATAQQLHVDEVHTYETKWVRYADIIGIPINEPRTDQERLL